MHLPVLARRPGRSRLAQHAFYKSCLNFVLPCQNLFGNAGLMAVYRLLLRSRRYGRQKELGERFLAGSVTSSYVERDPDRRRIQCADRRARGAP